VTDRFDADLPGDLKEPLEDLPLREEIDDPVQPVGRPVSFRGRPTRRRALFPGWPPEHGRDAGPSTLPFPPLEQQEIANAGASGVAAPLSPRLLAGFGDLFLAVLVAGIGIFAAYARNGAVPTLTTAVWATAFALYFSFIVSTLTLTLFGRTPGMALADLTARDEEGRLPAAGPAALRWAVSVLTAALLFLPLVAILFDEERRTPADRASGRSLRHEPEPEELL
jgi:RDD family